MNKTASVFVFSALSTVALIVMQQGPQDADRLPVATASEATRNDASILRPLVQHTPLPVPDDVITEIKQGVRPVALPEADVQRAPSAAQQSASLQRPAWLVEHAAKPTQATFSTSSSVQPEENLVTAPTPQTPTIVQPATVTEQIAATEQTTAPLTRQTGRASSELRDMSWSALGTLQQIGQVSKAPGAEGSLINSIVRRSMAHVEAPAVSVISAPQATVQQPAQRVAAAAPQSTPRVSARLRETPQLGGAKQSYTVVSGDNLALIAIKLYGSALRTDQLLADNPALRSNPNSLRIGQVITYRP